MGLDVFNYAKMGKLLEYVVSLPLFCAGYINKYFDRHFIAGYDSNLVDRNASISAETCILFLEILKDFLVQVISRVLILEEEYKRLRGTTKVWRKNADDVSFTRDLHFLIDFLYQNVKGHY
jgi:hypothetical protein